MIFYNNKEMVLLIGEILNTNIYSMKRFIRKQYCNMVVEYELC